MWPQCIQAIPAEAARRIIKKRANVCLAKKCCRVFGSRRPEIERKAVTVALFSICNIIQTIQQDIGDYDHFCCRLIFRCRWMSAMREDARG